MYPVVIASALFIGCSSSSPADESLPTTGKDSAPTYKDKAASEWINLLKSSADVPTRAQAAEALGFIARKGRWTYGGFSDVPIESPEPPQLEESALRDIVAALVDGLSDKEERVRASSAIAISWIGPRAKAAVPMLIRLLDDRDETTKSNALSAIGSVGPAAKEAISKLQPKLAKGKAFDRVQVAKAMRLIGATPDSYVPTLIDLLGEEDAAHYAAMELSELGDPAVPALLVALKDANPTRRQNAASAISNLAGWDHHLTKNVEPITESLIALTHDENKNVVWYAAQALGFVRAIPERSVPALVSLLRHTDPSVVVTSAQSLGEFGAEGAPARAALIELLSKKHDRSVAVDYTIRKIGIDRDSAVAISQLKLEAEGIWLFIPLCEYPELASAFLKQNPHVIDVPVGDRSALLALIRNPDPRFKSLQDLIRKNDQLPLAIMAQLGDRQFLPLIQQRQSMTTAYEKMQLDACARACGALAQQVVTISQSQPGDFKPKSAWPETDATRMSPDSPGHGDGWTEVIVTGTILREDGLPATAPKFYRVNDSMLLGERKREEAPITFDPQTGRFVFVTDVFAAYSIGKGQSEAGPYQTGSSMVFIESEGCQPLQVQFYDEMPEVRIKLSAGKEAPE